MRRSLVITSIILSALILIIVWGLGPWLAIGDFKPFVSMSSRLMTSTILAILWLVGGSIYIFYSINIRSESETTEILPQEQEVSNTLIKSWQHTRQFLKKHRAGSWWKPRQRHWLLLLGQTNTGKTTLLANSDIELSSPTQQTFSSIKPTQFINWWVSNRTVFVDLAGKIALPQQKDDVPIKAWQRFLQALKRDRHNNLFNAVVFVIDVPTLVNSNPQDIQQYAERLSQQLQVLKSFQSRLPILVVVSQCDRIAGFKEYFEDLGRDEREQILGFDITHTGHGTLIAELLEQHFAALTKQINEQLIWHLHQEQILIKRQAINEFPLQLEKLCKVLEGLLNQLPWSSKMDLCGVYFTSSLQQHDAFNILAEPVQQTFRLSKITRPTTRSAEQKPYFIKDLFAHLDATNRFRSVQSLREIMPRLIALPIAAVIITLATVAWHFSYQANANAIMSVAEKVNSIPTPTKTTKNIPWLHRLDQLETTIHHISSQRRQPYHWTGLGQGGNLKDEAVRTYNKLLTDKMQTYILDTLQQQIKQGIQDNTLKLYASLRIYLMLDNPKKYDRQSITHWFNHYWQQQYSKTPAIVNQLKKHLQELLQIPELKWPLQNKLIQQAQTTLQKTPLEKLAYLELQGQYRLVEVPIVENIPDSKAIDTSVLKIPEFFSADNFKAIYNQAIPTITQKLLRGDWVIGKTDTSSVSQSRQNQLTMQLRDLYLSNYVQAWDKIIPKIKFNTPTDMDQLQDALQLLTNKNSTLMQLLKLIVANATLKQANTLIPVKEQKNITLLQNFVNRQPPYDAIQQKLKKLLLYVSEIDSAANGAKAGYNASIERLKKRGTDDPIRALINASKQTQAPIKQWLNVITQSSWKIILGNAKKYLDSIWQSFVLPQYNSKVVNHFPVYTDATEEMSLADFTAFFGPDGTVDAFFTYYLKPFVDMSKKYWTWIKVDGIGINIPQKNLDMFNRAGLIQQMFFSSDLNSPSTKFSLRPVKMASNTQSFVMNLEGETVPFTLSSSPTIAIKWPGPKPGLVTLRFTGELGQTQTRSFSGPWAWFKLLQLSNVATTRSAKRFRVTFSVGDYSADYVIVANSLINPFIPGIVEKFRCPNDL